MWMHRGSVLSIFLLAVVVDVVPERVHKVNCSLRVRANSPLCLQCGKWIHGRCAGMKNVTPKS